MTNNTIPMILNLFWVIYYRCLFIKNKNMKIQKHI